MGKLSHSPGASNAWVGSTRRWVGGAPTLRRVERFPAVDVRSQHLGAHLPIREVPAVGQPQAVQ